MIIGRVGEWALDTVRLTFTYCRRAVYRVGLRLGVRIWGIGTRGDCTGWDLIIRRSARVVLAFAPYIEVFCPAGVWSWQRIGLLDGLVFEVQKTAQRHKVGADTLESSVA